MMSVEFWFDDSDSESDAPDDFLEIARKRKRLRDSSNPLELEESTFLKYFRVSKPAFQYLLNEMEAHLKPQLRRSSVPNILKVATALRFCAHGSYQSNVGNEFCIALAQSTVSLVMKEVFQAIENHVCPRWIQFKYSEAEKSRAKLFFYKKSGIPGIIGCVDGTHIRIASPKKDLQHAYYNSKGFYSINAMIVCDDTMKIRYINARYPGSMDDSSVFNMSELKSDLEESHRNGEENTWLLGDAGYTLKPYLLTPFRNPEEASPESVFNKKHAQARNIIGHTIGVLKNRFRCLLRARELHYSPEKATQITNVCVALHNICISYNVPVPDTNENNIDDGDEESIGDHLKDDSEEAEDIRNEILMYL